MTATITERQAAEAVDLLGVISDMLAGGKLGKALDAGGQGELKVRLMAAILDVTTPPLFPGAEPAYDLVMAAIADGRREGLRRLRAVHPKA